MNKARKLVVMIHVEHKQAGILRFVRSFDSSSNERRQARHICSPGRKPGDHYAIKNQSPL